MKESWYEILGVPTNAGAEQIRAAYRAIAMTCHPDRTQNDPEATKRFRQATEAFYVPSDPAKRAVYDRQFEPVRSVAQLFLSHAAGKRVLAAMLPSAPAEPKRGTNVCVVVSRSRLARARGMVLSLTVSGEVIQPKIPLEVPATINGLRICTLPHLGSPGRNGGENGDLIIVITDEEG